jgi:Trypsin
MIGDSGGPLFYYDNDGNPIQIGVVSFGPLESCATEDIAAGYARVSSAKDWIEIMSCEVFGSDYVPLCGDYIPVGAAASTECNTATETLFQFSIKMDDTAADISWELQNTDTEEVVFFDSGFSNREIVFYEGCLSNDVECWSLTINDEGLNPGFCCDGPDASDACCDGWKAGFGIVFGSGSALYFDNPEFEESTVSFDLCQRSYESESTEALVDSTTDDACTDVVITLTTDAWPEETSIVLLGDDFDIDFPFTKFDETETEYTFELCLTGCLRLMVLDDLQDGISPPGGVTITYGGEQVVADLADFAAGRVVEFGSGCPQAEVSFGSTCQDFEVVLSTDDSPEETAIVVLVGDDYNVLVHDSSLQPNTDYGYIDCLSGCVTVGILDTVGDGIGSPGFFSASYGDDSTGVITDYGFGKFFRLGDCPDGVSTETSVSAFSGHQIRA